MARKRLVVSPVSGGPQVVSIKARNAEVATEVEQVDGAEVAGYGDQGEAFGRFGQNDCTAHVDALSTKVLMSLV